MDEPTTDLPSRRPVKRSAHGPCTSFVDRGEHGAGHRTSPDIQSRGRPTGGRVSFPEAVSGGGRIVAEGTPERPSCRVAGESQPDASLAAPKTFRRFRKASKRQMLSEPAGPPREPAARFSPSRRVKNNPRRERYECSFLWIRPPRVVGDRGTGRFGSPLADVGAVWCRFGPK